MGGSARRVDVIASVALAHVSRRLPRRLAPSVLAGAVLVACLAWSSPAAAIVPAVRRDPPRVSAARHAPAPHPLTRPHVALNFGHSLEAVLSSARDGSRQAASAARRDCRHPAPTSDPNASSLLARDPTVRDIGSIPSHWGATHLSI